MSVGGIYQRGLWSNQAQARAVAGGESIKAARGSVSVCSAACAAGREIAADGKQLDAGAAERTAGGEDHAQPTGGGAPRQQGAAKASLSQARPPGWIDGCERRKTKTKGLTTWLRASAGR